MTVKVYYILYLLISVGCVFLLPYEKKLNNKSKSQIKFLIIILISLFMAFRPMDVPDTKVYYDMFVSKLNMSKIISDGVHFGTRYNHMEIGYLVIQETFKCMCNSFRAFVFTMSLLTSSMIINGTIGIINIRSNIYGNTEKNQRTLTVICCYFIFYGLLYSGIVIRGGLTIGIGIVVTYIYMKMTSKIKYPICIILLLIAMSIQTFAFVYLMILLVFVLNLGIDKKYYKIWYIVLIILLLIHFGGLLTTQLINIFNMFRDNFGITAFSSYLQIDNYVGRGDWYRLIVNGALVLFSYYDSDDGKPYLLLNAIGLSVMVIGYPFPAISRVADYFLISAIPLYTMFWNENNGIVSKGRITKKSLYFCFLLLMMFPIQLHIIGLF